MICHRIIGARATVVQQKATTFYRPIPPSAKKIRLEKLAQEQVVEQKAVPNNKVHGNSIAREKPACTFLVPMVSPTPQTCSILNASAKLFIPLGNATSKSPDSTCSILDASANPFIPLGNATSKSPGSTYSTLRGSAESFCPLKHATPDNHVADQDRLESHVAQPSQLAADRLLMSPDSFMLLGQSLVAAVDTFNDDDIPELDLGPSISGVRSVNRSDTNLSASWSTKSGPTSSGTITTFGDGSLEIWNARLLISLDESHIPETLVAEAHSAATPVLRGEAYLLSLLRFAPGYKPKTYSP